MSEDSRNKVEEILESPTSRSHFLKGAAVIAASVGLAPAAASAAGLDRVAFKRMDENKQTILNIAATAEAAAVTALYHVHLAVNQGHFSFKGAALPDTTLVSVVRGILRQEQDHYAFLTGAGARPLMASFSFPMAIFRSAVQALTFLETADTIFTGAYMAANREFASRGMNLLAQYTYQIGGTEAEHRALARAGLGLLPNNKSFETNLYAQVAGAAAELGRLGILKPGLAYPGAQAVDRILRTSGDHRVTAGVTQRHP